MDYEKFKEAVIEHVQEYLPDTYADAEISIHSVIKNNSVRLDGLMIKIPDSNIAPNIYLNHYYDQYKNGKDFDEILNEIASVRTHSCDNPFPEVGNLTCLEQIRDRIQAKLVNRTKNKEYLQDKPFTQIADLAVIYYISLKESDYGHASVIITDNMLSLYGISVEDLHSIALSNMRGKEAQFLTMAEVLRGLMPDVEDTFDHVDTTMYVLTNADKLNGAAMLLDIDTMDRIAEKIGTSYYILPSSVHETIIVPASITESSSLENLAEMVIEINGTQVAPDEVLSDHVYRYNYTDHTLEIAA
ncbi:MAG: hypothetical protein J5518_02860 [Lachnospiraceae bacterium]|nr:hypothetical protein [Lachnospiraceae bacterium]